MITEAKFHGGDIEFSGVTPLTIPRNRRIVLASLTGTQTSGPGISDYFINMPDARKLRVGWYFWVINVGANALGIGTAPTDPDGIYLKIQDCLVGKAVRCTCLGNATRDGLWNGVIAKLL